MFLCLRKKSPNEALAATTALVSGVNGDRANLRQMRAIKMQRTAANDSAVVFQDDEVADILANLSEASRQQSAVPRVGRDERLDLFGIRQDGSTSPHRPSVAGSAAHVLKTSVPHSSLAK
jgi:hypothetical protein